MDGKEERDRSRDRERSRRDRTTRFTSESRDRSPDRGKERGGMKSSNCRVYVSNIPYEYRWQDLKDLFRSQVGDVAFVELFVDENEKPRGCGIVEFAEPNSVKKCLESMHRFELKGRKIVIKEDFGNQRDKYGNLVGKRRDRDEHRELRRDDHSRYENVNMPNAPSMPGPSVSGNTYGLSPAFLHELNISTPLSTRIFVANLEYKVDKKKLKDVFRMAGKVQYVDMPLGKDGTSRGFAVVVYDHPVESVQAISMFHGQPLYDRLMTVRMDRGIDREKLPEGLKTVGPGLGTNGEPLRDVAHNLPSLSSPPPNASGGQGILGAVPNLQLGLNAANPLNLNSLTSVNSALSNLNSTSAAVLQAANLAGVSNLSNNLLSSLSSSDLNLAANLVQNNSSLAALAATTGNLNNPGGGGGSLSRADSQPNFLSSPAQGQNSSYGSGNSLNLGNMARNYQSSYESKPAFNFGGSDRDTRPPSNNNIYGSLNNGGQMMRSNPMLDGRKKNKLLIANLPASASYKLISEKCQEFGHVENVEEQGQGSILVTFQTEWDAERAMKNIDRGRIDGRSIEARLC